MAGGKMSKAKVSLEERRAMVLSLRKSGLSYRAVSQQVAKKFDLEKYTESHCHQDLKAALKGLREVMRDDAEDYLTMEMIRYDDWLTRLMPGIQSGDVQAIGTALKISQWRCKLLGLEPTLEIKVEQVVTTEFLVLFQQLQTILPAETVGQVIGEAKKLPSLAAAAQQLETTVDVDSKVISIETIKKIREHIYGVYDASAQPDELEGVG